jgi:mono/diheme cytochrome c family protein
LNAAWDYGWRQDFVEESMPKKSLRIRGAIASLALLMLTVADARAAEALGASDGKAILAEHCSRCHSIEATGPSPLDKAPPLREVYLRYPIEQLEGGFAEGMGSKHRDMPQIQFSAEQVAAILNYLGGITGVPSAKKPRSPVPGETPP